MEEIHGIKIRPDLVGKKYGDILIVGAPFRVRKSSERTDWMVVVQCCRCLSHKCCFLDNIIGQKTKSCGCLRDAKVQEAVGKHNKTGTSIYNAWLSMKARCYNPKNKAYANYGGRGIKVCDRWLGESGFLNFYADVGDRPSDGHSLDRIDNEGDYGPDNCRWATKIEQSLNKRCSLVLTIDGVTKHCREWADERGLAYGTVIKRMKKGCKGEECLKPSRNKKPYHKS